MSAREWPDDALKAMHQAMFEDAYDGTNLPLLGAGADAFATALAAAGYRILAPGEMDRETLEAAAKVADKFDCWLGSYESVVAQNNYEGGVLDASQGIAAAIRALGGGEG